MHHHYCVPLSQYFRSFPPINHGLQSKEWRNALVLLVYMLNMRLFYVWFKFCAAGGHLFRCCNVFLLKVLRLNSFLRHTEIKKGNMATLQFMINWKGTSHSRMACNKNLDHVWRIKMRHLTKFRFCEYTIQLSGLDQNQSDIVSFPKMKIKFLKMVRNVFRSTRLN